MRYYLRTQSGRDFEIEVEPDGEDGYRVRVGGRPLHAGFTDVDRLGQYSAILDGRSYAASIEEFDAQHLMVNIAGEAWTVEALDERERAAGELAGVAGPRAETVQSVMPGVMVAVHVQAGDAVEAGQALAVLEAMKMQNEVCCQHGGVVEEVLVAAGDAVEAGQDLIRLAPPDAD